EGFDVVGEVAVVGDDRGATAQDRVPGEQGAVRREMQADRVGGVPGRGDDVDLGARGGERIAGGQALVAAAERGVGGQDRGAGHGGERRGALGVVRVGVGEQDLGNPLASGGDLVTDTVQVAR